MKLRFLGGTGQVERSSVLVEGSESRILIDYGVKLSKPPIFPLHVAPRELDALLISHAHLDHSGGSPLLYVSGEMNCYLTSATLDFMDLLIKDFIKLSGQYIPYEYFDFQTLRNKSVLIDYGEEFSVKGEFAVKALDAGHIPGSCQFLIDCGLRILYTGDINNVETRLLKSMETEYGELDVIITESTYAGETHPSRRKQERKFVESVTEVVENKGVALIPAFAVGRSQEILLILHERGFKHTIYMDGMAVQASEICLRHPEYVKDAHKLEKALNRVEIVSKWRQRKKIVKEPCAIIAPAGMLGGGTVVFYLSKLYDDEKNAIFIVGYQVPGTPGKMLLEEGKAFIKGRIRKIKMRAERYHFSSHIDHSGFRRLFKGISGSPVFFIIHGESKSLKAMSDLLSKELGFEVQVPKLGEEFEVSGNRVVKRG